MTQLFTYLLTHSVTRPLVPTDSENATFRVCGRGVGPVTPKFELGGDFCTTQLATKFYLGDRLTDKRDAAENMHVALLCDAGE